MIIATVKMKGLEEKRREILQTLSGITEQVKLCKGCMGACCTQDISDPNTFYHIQEWQSRQDLTDHLNSTLFSALLGIKTILTEKPSVEFMHTLVHSPEEKGFASLSGKRK